MCVSPPGRSGSRRSTASLAQPPWSRLLMALATVAEATDRMRCGVPLPVGTPARSVSGHALRPGRVARAVVIHHRVLTPRVHVRSQLDIASPWV